MKVLVACEESGTVRRAFRKRGHNAISCDLLPPSDGDTAHHYQGDVFDIVDAGWDLMICHPPCTYLCVSGARWLYDPRYPDRMEQRDNAVKFARALYDSDVPRVALENPVSMLSSLWRKPDQSIHPYQFGDPVSKKTCLWLKNLPQLQPTNVVEVEYVTTPSGKKWSKWFFDTSCITRKNGERSRVRSKTFDGIAEAMAEQWGNLE